MKKVLVFILSFAFSCAMPRVIVLDDPLTAEEHLNLGYIYERKGELKPAKEEYEKALQKDKNMWKAHFNLGNVYAKMEDYAKAEREYKRALELKPNDPDILNNLAWVLYKQGRKEEALLLIKKAISIDDREEYRNTLREIEGS
ncbi:TPR repeat-containing protein [Hydrogenobacter thermophilus TK-6]|uniref:TPR repeat protein n=1 Tax=Hydrogenobacter thermophilus (strain DSM 6534 / IAM 12695 / TK-6) TaxID=608538 RepID=D3DFT5_HYDTT|nr:tetratricopeptide repeat protein [Hydrogenobacter thermophilus]ADO44627.1 TPR repeat-containing protein [Hydrogenobacter thermophilus TK-6]BAI68687.1 TPR repeat protein [Hydrogenobacter thermophilus TK-6]